MFMQLINKIQESGVMFFKKPAKIFDTKGRLC